MNIFIMIGGALMLFGVAQETILKPKATVKPAESVKPAEPATPPAV